MVAVSDQYTLGLDNGPQKWKQKLSSFLAPLTPVGFFKVVRCIGVTLVLDETQIDTCKNFLPADTIQGHQEQVLAGFVRERVSPRDPQ